MQTTDKQKHEIQLVLALGPPGAGKGTHCKHLAADFGWYHLSIGDYLRELITSETTFASAAFGGLTQQELADALKKQQLVPAENIAAIVAHKIEQERKQGHERVIVDGYPRQIGSAELLEKQVAKPLSVLQFECAGRVAKERFLARKRKAAGGGEDDEKVFEQRYLEYLVNNKPIRERYDSILLPVETEGDVEDVFKVVKALFQAVVDGLGSK